MGPLPLAGNLPGPLPPGPPARGWGHEGDWPTEAPQSAPLHPAPFWAVAAGITPLVELSFRYPVGTFLFGRSQKLRPSTRAKTPGANPGQADRAGPGRCAARTIKTGEGASVLEAATNNQNRSQACVRCIYTGKSLGPGRGRRAALDGMGCAASAEGGGEGRPGVWRETE